MPETGYAKFQIQPLKDISLQVQKDFKNLLDKKIYSHNKSGGQEVREETMEELFFLPGGEAEIRNKPADRSTEILMKILEQTDF